MRAIWRLTIAAVAYGVAMVPGLCSAAPASPAAAPPADFPANMDAGPGLKGQRVRDSPHFRIVGVANDSVSDGALRQLEAAYACFVDGLGWRSPGLSYKVDNDDGPYYKVNVYRVDDIPGAAANTGLDQRKTGLSFLNVVTKYMTEPAVVVHEFGHSLTYAERYWIEQGRTGAWWETVANFVADSFLTAPFCEPARARYGQKGGDSLVDLRKTIGDSHQVLVDGTRDTGNYYQAWPFLSYLVYNPDGHATLGPAVFPAVWRRYKRGSNETPLHAIERVAAPAVRIQAVVGRYWARMAYVDIGHAKARQAFLNGRKSLTYANLDAVAGGGGVGGGGAAGGARYRVKPARQPRYMGANIIPLRLTGGGGGGSSSTNVTVTVTAGAPFTATLAIRGTTGAGAVRYVDLPGGRGGAAVSPATEEASLVVANTPDTLALYDPFQLTPEVSKGLDYQVVISGATAA